MFVQKMLFYIYIYNYGKKKTLYSYQDKLYGHRTGSVGKIIPLKTRAS